MIQNVNTVGVGGISIFESTTAFNSGGHFILNNTIRNTTGGNCIHLEGTDNNTIINNTCDNITQTGSRWGIRLQTTSDNPHVRNNIFYQNTLSRVQNIALAQRNIAGAVNNTFVFSNFTGNGFNVDPIDAGNFFNTSRFGNFWDDLNHSNFTDSDLDGFYDSGPGHPYSNATGGNVSPNVSDYRPCKSKNCLGLADRSPAWNGTVTSQAVFFSVRSNAVLNLTALAVQLNGAPSAAFSLAACVSAWSDLLGYTANCTYTETGIASGSNSIVVNATDADGINGNFTLNFTYTPPATPTPAPVTGGSGGGTCCPPAPPPARAGEPVVFVLPPGAPVEKIEVVTDEPVAVKVTVKPLPALPLSAPPPPGPVARFMEVSLTNPVGEAVRAKSVAMEFSVERTWMNHNDVPQERVALARLEGEKWNPYPAKVVSESPAEVKFKAEVPGTSVFAITVAPAATSPPSPSPTPLPSQSPSPTRTPPIPSASPTPGTLPPLATPTPRQPGFEVGVAISALVAVELIRRSYRRRFG